MIYFLAEADITAVLRSFLFKAKGKPERYPGLDFTVEQEDFWSLLLEIIPMQIPTPING